MPSIEDRNKLELTAAWEASKAGMCDILDEDLQAIVDVAGGIADESGMNFAKEWIVDYFQAYEALPGIFEAWSAEVAQREAAEDAQIRNTLALGAAAAAQAAADKRASGLFNDLDARVQAAAQLKRRYPHLDPTVEEIRRPDSVFNKLPEAELMKMERHLAGHRVTEWSAIHMGDTNVRMPYRVTNFALALGPEITRDWIIPREGHGHNIKMIASAWNTTQKHPDLCKPNQTDGKWAYELNKKRLVVNGQRNVVITYFETPYGT